MKTKSLKARGRMPDNSPNPIDIHVGTRIKLRRQSLKISQKTLAKQIGITFQQIQKYEKGSNRISASRLWDIANALNCSIEFFFSNMPVKIQNLSPSAIITGLPASPVSSTDPLKSAETLELIRDYQKIKIHSLKTCQYLKLLIHQISLSPTPKKNTQSKLSNY